MPKALPALDAGNPVDGALIRRAMSRNDLLDDGRRGAPEPAPCHVVLDSLSSESLE